MTADSLSTQIVKATMTRLLGEQSLKAELRANYARPSPCCRVCTTFSLNARLFHDVRLHQRPCLRLADRFRMAKRLFSDGRTRPGIAALRSEEHTSELQSRLHLV